jgi:DNA-binding NarL/FixJ family response regulator
MGRRAACLNRTIDVKTKRKRIVIVDDHVLLRQGLERLLDLTDEFLVCGQAGNAAEGLAVVRKTRPDAVIVDVSLPDTNGIELTRQLVSEFPKLPVLILSMHDEAEFGARARKAGAIAYILKSEAIERLHTALSNALAGRRASAQS